MEPWRYGAQGVLLAVRVTPRGGRDAIDGVEILANGRPVLKIRVRVAAEGGQANGAVADLLAKRLGLPKSRIAVISGITSRLKQVEIGGEPAAIGAALKKLVVASGDTTE